MFSLAATERAAHTLNLLLLLCFSVALIIVGILMQKTRLWRRGAAKSAVTVKATGAGRKVARAAKRGAVRRKKADPTERIGFFMSIFGGVTGFLAIIALVSSS